jgi:hypothetical protein
MRANRYSMAASTSLATAKPHEVGSDSSPGNPCPSSRAKGEHEHGNDGDAYRGTYNPSNALYTSLRA